MLFDTHCHLQLPQLQDDVAAVVDRAFEAQVGAIVAPGIDIPSSEAAVRLAHRFPGKVFAAVGIHPNDAGDMLDQGRLMAEREALAALIASERDSIVAIGETGLDFYRDSAPPDVQKAFFKMHIELARETGLPLIVHSRDSAAEVVAILSQYPLPPGAVVLHSYTEGRREAEIALAAGWLLSFNGIATYPNAQAVREALDMTPLDQLMIETDAPYLAPQRFRGARNEPAYIRATFEFVANHKRQERDSFERLLWQTSILFFGLQGRV